MLLLIYIMGWFTTAILSIKSEKRYHTYRTESPIYVFLALFWPIYVPFVLLGKLFDVIVDWI